MIRVLNRPSQSALKRILGLRRVSSGPEEALVREIIRQVEKRGDRALFAYTRRFDGAALGRKNLRIGRAELVSRARLCDPGLKKSIRLAIRNIRRFHEKQKTVDFTFSPEKGVHLGQRSLPVENVAIYVPGGHHPLFSSALMTVVPAQAAGVPRLAVCTPPRRQGLDPALAYCLLSLNVREIYRMGGAQAVAALALGTESVDAVDKIVGPGNLFVSLAKKLLFGVVDIDMIAGPSEICVIADKGAPAAFIARDLLSQSEHGSGLESSMLLTTDRHLAENVRREVLALLADEPAGSPVRRALSRHGFIAVMKSLDQCAETANLIAPEHLEIMTRSPRRLLPKIRNAGAVFLGKYSCESLGDYFAGPSHVLPTHGSARFFSPLSAYDFMKRTSVIEYGKEAAGKAASHVARMARGEGLPFHAQAALIRKG